MREESFAESARQYLRPLPGGMVSYHPPPSPTEIALTSHLINLLADANHALGDLDGTGRRLPNPHILIGPYLRREAVLSSRIEGTQSGLSDVLLVEAGGIAQPDQDTKEVLNYVA